MSEEQDLSVVEKRELLITLVIILAFILALAFDAYAQNEQFVQSVTVKHQETYDTRGIQFFELRRGAESALISVSDQSELGRFLQRNNGAKLILTLEKP